MANPNQRHAQGRHRDSGRRDERGDDGHYYGYQGRDDDDQPRWSRDNHSPRGSDDDRVPYGSDYRGGPSGHDLGQPRFERCHYHGGARDYDSASRRYYGSDPGRELYSSPSQDGQPYGGESYEWQPGQHHWRGQRLSVYSQSGYYRERDEYSGDRSQAGDDGRDLDGRGRPSRHSGYAERWQGGRGERTGYGRSGAEGVYGYARSSYGQPEDHIAGARQSQLRDGGHPGQSQRGRGPRNYARSDERIREDLSEQLTSHDDIDASDIDITVKDGVVSLAGSVEQRRVKYAIEDMAERCRGVKDVDNRLTVRARSSGDANRAPFDA